MGSLTSRPKVPAPSPQPQIVYVPAPTSSVSPSTTTPSTINPAPTVAEEEPSVEEQQAVARVENLLRRNRGTRGTIQTGFRGLLSPNDLIPERKALLGE